MLTPSFVGCRHFAKKKNTKKEIKEKEKDAIKEEFAGVDTDSLIQQYIDTL